MIAGLRGVRAMRVELGERGSEFLGAGVGLQPDAGRRRSTRVSCKPLEWWRNERKVYERKFHSAPLISL